MLTDAEKVGSSNAASSSPAARAFSRAAQHYDVDQHANRIASWSRQRSIDILERYFLSNSRLLEIGCGTGEEAIHLARRGASIVATDAAHGMLAVLDAKLSAEPLLDARITPYVLPAHDLDRLLSVYGKAYFAGAYSSFGPLNCEPDLAPVALALSDLLEPDSTVVLSFVNKYCAWEVIWHLLRGRFRTAFRRFGHATTATVRFEWQEEKVPVFYPRVDELEHTFAPYFTDIARIALPWLLPPQYLDRILRHRPRLFKAMSRIDRLLSNYWPFNVIGDHVVVVMRRKATGSWERTSLPLWRQVLRRIARQALLWRFRSFVPGQQRRKLVRAAGERLLIEPSVFDPSIHFTSVVMARYLRSRLRAAHPTIRVLDVGTGSGLLAIAAARAGVQRVTAVDLNLAAVRSARRNVKASGLTAQVRVQESDMFGTLEGEQYDIILTNPPYYPRMPTNDAEQAYFAGANLEWLRRFANGAHYHLAADGYLLMVVGETAPVEIILSIFGKSGWSAKLVQRKVLTIETILVFEFKPTNSTSK
jgi:methylase of polypeptide subunit release factors